jgi:D-cysteine desulfhydrase
MIDFPTRLRLAQTPTPLQPLDRISDQLGGPRLWVKRDDLTGCAITGNKVRKLEFILAQAINQGADTLITCGGIQSNHCRATAILGAQLGLKVHLILRGDAPTSQSQGNLFLDELAGANISYHPLSEYQELPQLFEYWQQYYRALGHKPFAIPTGASNGTGAWGYIACAGELKDDFSHHEISPGLIVCATGSGGTQAGLTAGAQLFELNTPVLGMAVCDDKRYFLEKVRQDLRDWKVEYQQSVDIESIPINVNDRHIGPGYAKCTPEVFATIKTVAATEGIIFDPVYSGKAFHGLVEEIRAGQYRDVESIVFVHTGGLFGLFAQRDQL